MAIHFLDFPSEIIILILYSLDLPTLMSCIATNRRVKSIIDGSALLQYRLATQAACVEDNPWNTDATSAQRLTALRKRQTAFAELLPSFIRTIQMDDFPILATYALSGGMFFMAEAEKKALRWTSLASVEQQTPVWERLEIDEYILEFTLAIPEEDLLVVLSSCVAFFASMNTYESGLELQHRTPSIPSGHRCNHQTTFLRNIHAVCPPQSSGICCACSYYISYTFDNES
jgi:hypothetical protein